MLLSTQDSALLTTLQTCLGAHNLDHVAVAVSGGGDSVALLHLMGRIASRADVRIKAVTVDHRLRPEAADEALQVSRWAAEWGVEHTTLTWSGWNGEGNLQAKARKARYDLMAQWARQQDIPAILLGHTIDDQAETVLMGLSRASGVDGLAAMPEQRSMRDVILLRPLLGHNRQDLRNYLRGQGLDWIDDPSNQNTRYERVRMRQAGAALSDLGLSTPALARVAQNMAHVQDALDYHTQVAAREICQVDAGDVVLDMDQFVTLPQETARRLLLGAVAWVNGGRDHPRRHPTMMALSAMGNRTPAQLGGCRIVKQRNRMRVCREYSAVRNLRAKPGEFWDARWCLSGPDHHNVRVAALGEEGLMQCPDWRETGRPHAALIAAPAAWRGREVVAAPFAAAANGWSVQGPTSIEEFLETILSH